MHEMHREVNVMKCPECKSEKVRQTEDLRWLVCENCGATFMLMKIDMIEYKVKKHERQSV